jgi:hypothetical protein
MAVAVIRAREKPRSAAFEFKVTPACRDCGAPGVYSDEERIRDGWPGCFIDPASKLTRDRKPGEPVGKYCPNCGDVRPEDDDLGTVAYWHRNPLRRALWRVGRWLRRK